MKPVKTRDKQSRRPSADAAVQQEGFAEVAQMIEAAREQTLAAVNAALIDLYWQVGKTISIRIAGDGWGKGTVTALASRMHDQMLDHGLDPPLLGTDMGYFQITFPGPGDNIERLRVPEKRLLVTRSVEAQLNERQKKAVREVLESGFVSSGWLVKKLGVTYDTANRDLKGLAELKLLIRQGQGRAAKYVLWTAESSS